MILKQINLTNIKQRDRVLAKVVEKQATITKTPDVSRIIQESTYDPNLLLSGYVVLSADHLSSSLVTIQKEVERLDGILSSKIDDIVGIVVNLQGIFPFKFFN
ncbi:unnamed protein product [Rotaria sordida]|uniref:Uncharacterized protein n=1 Tax=Rotaria sordida TaxID=392033 RepID=A0A819PLY0_9BILA|nr:unnamed protein product [Rotaria sordida]CAF4010076.1 unnamed protein product [Rotaria sordida]